jgi:hypothetical protein
MTQWKLKSHVCITNSASDIWGKKDKKTGKSDWDIIAQ